MRGKARKVINALGDAGITPAYAGKSYLIGTGLGDTKDHPRVCGEKRSDRLDYYVPQGSPPRMRGKAGGPHRAGHPHGITPAYAGKRLPLLTLPGIWWDHPRVCGEKRPAGYDVGADLGITPAYAGKSCVGFSHLRLMWDHPRVCGEKYLEMLQPLTEWGSPPRMRGKDLQCK